MTVDFEPGYPSNTMNRDLDELIERSLREDLGDGDHTSLACIPESEKSTAHLLLKETGILAGVEVAKRIFEKVDPSLELRLNLQDGHPVNPGDVGFEVSGSARSILSAERLVLNCMQRMSGIATYTDELCTLIAGTGATLLDTRKTSPGLRVIEKMAVKIGGGENHRFGLFDMIMIKDNHIDFAGGVKQAIQRAHDYLDRTQRQLPIEVETRSLDELDEVLAIGGVQRIMLDNYPVEELRIAVDRIGGRYETEASGGITESSIRSVAQTGVQYISVGALTHSVKSLDMSLKAVD